MIKFGNNILNGKELRKQLGISTTVQYQLLKAGMPYLQISPNGRKYYNLESVEQWLLDSGFKRQMSWTR